MKFDCVIMNPPYSGSLHLKILEKALKFKKEGGVLVNLSPVRWLEDPLWKYKRNTDHEKYQESIVDKLSSLKVIACEDGCKAFNIGITSDLGIYKFDNTKEDLPSFLANWQQSVLEKVLSYSKNHNIAMHLDKNKVDGWRIKSCFIMHGAPQGNPRKDRANIYYQTDVPLKDGYTEDGIFWSNATSQSKGKELLPFSIKFNTKEEAQNYLDSLKTNFVKNLIMITMWDVHVPHFALPYMEDYSYPWTDEMYCEFFQLTPEEAEFMCRDVEDYRVKDFIKYEEV